MAVRLQKVIDATMCAIITGFIRDLLDFMPVALTSRLYNGIDYIGTDSLIKRFAAKKAG